MLYPKGDPPRARRVTVATRAGAKLTLANDGAFATPVDLFYKPTLGTSTGVPFVTLTLSAGQQTTIPDDLRGRLIPQTLGQVGGVKTYVTGTTAGIASSTTITRFSVEVVRTTTAPRPV